MVSIAVCFDSMQGSQEDSPALSFQKEAGWHHNLDVLARQSLSQVSTKPNRQHQAERGFVLHYLG
jgi:hypothetical protein